MEPARLFQTVAEKLTRNLSRARYSVAVVEMVIGHCTRLQFLSLGSKTLGDFNLKLLLMCNDSVDIIALLAGECVKR